MLDWRTITQVSLGDSTQEIPFEDYRDMNYASHHDDDVEIHLLSELPIGDPGESWKTLDRMFGRLTGRDVKRHMFRHSRQIQRNQLKQWLREGFRIACVVLLFLLAIVLVFGIFLPSYTRPPPHYVALRERVQHAWDSASANVKNEKVFIAASIFDLHGGLARGQWAKDVLRLIHILGPENVYLSIFENDSGAEARDGLAFLEQQVPCNHTLIYERHIDLEKIPHIRLPDGTQRIKRIAYLAEVRNRALEPLETSEMRFDKLLYLNDIVFDPIEAAQLLFCTNINPMGRTRYRSACAVDFINPFKFYDTFATRDLDGYSMGVPFFPWFSARGRGETLNDLLSDKDAVRVRSCWGGMVAFDAKFFQNWSNEAVNLSTAANTSPMNKTAPYRFRAEEDLWWDSSECCLIQSDIQSPDTSEPEVYMNPFVRVAYDTRTLSWLWLTKRFEKLYTPIHFIADILVSLPDFNPRRDEAPWQLVQEVVWVSDNRTREHGSWQKLLRTAEHYGFCGRRALQVMKQNITSSRSNYEFIDPPR